ncbi:hypothetical protein BV394_11805 [Brevirhabdus pacifica]|uniref:Uncharacterized protein n=2 Tax=Brevirhabdus pacifica TaxID=1267768 RepID=A0A1U7DJY8_9RHOB|nr:hypothetical protein BV394_11805 [Brevirhabdus pacifica]OWU78633.1 hypothetical protein ATO5_07650 [Loktanella sp. 22II-4b]PJJ80779.1 ABC-type nitrate/sulfonate/bicarbonate transport system permease component [Brevirhabdus pacifica]
MATTGSLLAGHRAFPRNSKRSQKLGQLIFVVGFFLILELLVRSGILNRLIIAEPSRVLLRLWQDLFTQELWTAFLVTFWEVGVALVMSLLVGLVGGGLLYHYSTVRKALQPVLVGFYSAPAILLYPVFMTLLGPNSLMIITMATIMGAVPISVNLAIGFGGIDPILLKLGRSLNLRGPRLMGKILIPAATPVLFAGFRMGLTFALIAVIGLEFLTYSGGLGRLISWRYSIFDSEGVYAAIAIVCCLAMAVNYALGVMERRIVNRF